MDKVKKEAYDLFEMVDKELGYSQRDAHDHFGGSYKDFWHYQLDHCFGDMVRNDSFNSIYVGLEDFPIKDTNDWRYKIQSVYNELFSDIADETGYIDVWICW